MIQTRARHGSKSRTLFALHKILDIAFFLLVDLGHKHTRELGQELDLLLRANNDEELRCLEGSISASKKVRENGPASVEQSVRFLSL